jgi:hypothetical protein
MIRHASPTQSVVALTQTMAESASISLLVPTVGGVLLLASRLLSAGGAAVALSTITQAANPKETTASSCATKSHSENDLGTDVSLRTAHDDDSTRTDDAIRACGADADMFYISGERSKKYVFR